MEIPVCPNGVGLRFIFDSHCEVPNTASFSCKNAITLLFSKTSYTWPDLTMHSKINVTSLLINTIGYTGPSY